MADEIESALVLSEGVLVSLKDGREALINSKDLVDCAEKTHAFAKAESMITKDEESS